ncbi:sine oculis-binding protein homolog isoform X1 [Limulus polyphemus]|uniref:Sine oculis-binding protein homolog isoform X1 n=1 Tax=Limulus polyphemus TaxID=6850 RepID=A0ABM1S370_LIMPO|nr:sine oculis-binding protein homolog isoform X1 [Limulus polyphemus]XP_022238075.1 sine oculis-binding protein homolog isoform X1 [Limulus polyphemus]XP_022238076.1 sine oculis-binding protein homolog isoform X1 [Limulus polyphemus]
MNELLGWYGYEKLDSRETQGLNLQHFTAATSPRTSSTPDGSGSEDTSRDVSSNQGATRVLTPGTTNSETKESSPRVEEYNNLPSGCIICAWCQKVGMKLFTLKTTNGSKAFCSELCFTQCRRASFKKNKVCDWCKHVRHTVNYVDFQDGEQQLQFCSDKCLNQYRMNIFCKETQAHLQMHPHLKEAACKISASGSMNLITPELWLQDCKTPGFTNGHGPKSSETMEDRDTPPVDRNKRTTSSTPLSLNASGNSSFRENEIPTRQSSKGKEQDKPRRSTRNSTKHYSETTLTPPHRHTVRSPSITPHSPPNVGLHSSLLNGPCSTINSHQSHAPSNVPPPFPFGPDHMRPQMISPSMYPSPLNLMAQQQMEALFRMQHGLGIRPSLAPLPVPPSLMPPIPPLSQTSVPCSFPSPQPHLLPHTQTHSSSSSSLFPPVTMMVPCPIPFPIPIPIPIFLPLSPKLWEKAKSQFSSGENESQPQTSLTESLGNLPSNKNNKTRKTSEVSSTKRVDSVITKLVSEQRIPYSSSHSNTLRLSPGGIDNTSHFSSRITQSVGQGEKSFDESTTRCRLLETVSTDDDNFTSEDSELGALGTSGLDASPVYSYSFSNVALRDEGDRLNVDQSANCYNSVVKPVSLRQKRPSPESVNSTSTYKRKCIQENSPK